MSVRDQLFRPRAAASDQEAFAFLEAYVDSFVKWDVLHYFYYHPNLISTAETVAQAIARALDDVTRALTELAEQGVLQASFLGEGEVYALSQDPQIMAGLRAFIEAATRDDFRYRAIFHLVRGPVWRD